MIKFDNDFFTNVLYFFMGLTGLIVFGAIILIIYSIIK